MKTVNLKPPQIAFGLLALSGGLHLAITRGQHPMRCLVCAIALFLAGFGLMMWAWAGFQRAKTPIRPTDTATTLVIGGPFRFTRNPMYLGIVLMLLAAVFGVGTWPMLLAPIGFFLIISAVFIPYEEQRLKEIFGKQYENYQKRIRRWL